MPPQESPVELASQPQRLAALVTRAREAYQANLLEAAERRKGLDQKIRAAREQADADGRRFSPDPALLDRYSSAWTQYGEAGGSPVIEFSVPGDLRSAEEVWSECVRRCDKVLADYRVVRQNYDESQRRIFGRPKVEPKIPDQFRVDLWMMKAVLDVLPETRRKHVEDAVAEATRTLTATCHAEAVERDQKLGDFLGQVRNDVAFGINLLGDLGKSWSQLNEQGEQAVNPRDHGVVRLGRFKSVIPQTIPFEVPCVIDFPADHGLAIEAPLDKAESALSLARSVVLRALAGTPAGRLHLSIIDPVAIGRSFAEFLHLGDYDERLVDTRPRTSSRDIETRLEEHAAHLETMIAKYLRGQFPTIRDYNSQAEEMAEPYRLLVVCDYPTQFSDRSSELLLSLVQNGPRCGLYSLILYDPTAAASAKVPLARLLQSVDRITWSGQDIRVHLLGAPKELDVVPDRCPEISFARNGSPDSSTARFLANLGSAARMAEDRVVDIEHTFSLLGRNLATGLVNRLPVLRPGASAITIEDQATWWGAETSSGATALLGRSGAQAVAPLFFSSTEIAGGALMVGLPRSGKTTSLHAAILSMSIIYSPEELELYLIDAKHGVEFAAYRDLPHARMVAINSEREFAVAVLNSLDREIARRAELMKARAPGRTNLQEYRQATGDRLPRVVAIIDEFHEIFEEDDQLGQQAFSAFSNIVRQGPFAGVHVVLASQTLSSMPAMDRNTLTLLPARVAFACNEFDGQLVMGDNNPDVRFLSSAGEGLLNPNRGDPIHNVKFQGTFVPPDRRQELVRQLITKAGQAGWSRRPRVFDGDSLANRALVPPEAFTDPADRPLRFRFIAGEPLSLEDHLAIVLRRSVGQNLALVGKSEDDGIPESSLLGVLHSILIAAARQVPDVQLVDLVNDEGDAVDGDDSRRVSLSELCSTLSLETHRRRALGKIIGETSTLVAERVQLEDYRSPGRLLVLVGVQRASELDPENYDDDSVSRALQGILRDGPEVGVHTVLIADSLSGLQRRLGGGVLDDIAIRIAGQLGSDQERQQILDVYRPIDLRGSQLSMFDRERNLRLKFRPYGPVNSGWLTLAALDARLTSESED